MTYQLSIIIPVFNEEDIINQTIAYLNILNFDRDFEIIVVDGNPAEPE